MLRYVALLMAIFAVPVLCHAQNPDNTAQYWYWDGDGPYGLNRTLKIATLVASASNTADHLRLTATTSQNEFSYTNSYLDISFANRNGFDYFYTVHGAPIAGCSHITAYQQTDGSVDIYFLLAGNSGCWNLGTYEIVDNLGDTVYGTPADLGNGTPPGTLIFDSADPTHYPAQEYIDYAGNVGLGTSSPSAKLEVDGNIKLTSGSGASITFPDGTVQSTAYNGSGCVMGTTVGPATAPTGSCSTNGTWVFSQDGHATFCANGTWTAKI